jgi:hypothetical protein
MEPCPRYAAECQCSSTEAIVSTLNIVDLAGAERFNKASVKGDPSDAVAQQREKTRIAEANVINGSLAALGTQIGLLDAGCANFPPCVSSSVLAPRFFCFFSVFIVLPT